MKKESHAENARLSFFVWNQHVSDCLELTDGFIIAVACIFHTLLKFALIHA